MRETTTTESPDWSAPPEPSVAEGVRESGQSLSELLGYVGYLAATKIDQLKLSIRTLIGYAVAGVLALVAGVTLLVVSIVFLFVGIADGLGTAMGGRYWLGDLIVSVVLLGGAALGALMMMGKLKSASRRRMMEKYEERRKQQRDGFGHDVADRAAESGSFAG